MSRGEFYDRVRGPLFGGALRQGQVDGMEVILDTWDRLLEDDTWPDVDPRWIAYPLATAYHETGRTMQPVREVGLGRGKPYGVTDPETGQVYYGRGHVQMTWRSNYQKQQDKLKLPLVSRPDLALDPRTSALILLRGMADGDFTGRSLRHYFRADGGSDPIQARNIVNGMDRAAEIAGYYGQFLAALRPRLVA